MFENLSEKLDRALQVIKGDHKISEIKIAETAKEIRRVLVDADVNYKIAKEFTDRVKEKAEKVKRKIDAGIDRTAEKISDVSDSVQQHATHVKHAVKEKVARAADSVKEKAQHISDSMRETK